MWTYVLKQGSWEKPSPFKWLSRKEALIDMDKEVLDRCADKDVDVTFADADKGLVELSDGSVYQVQSVEGSF